MHIKTKLWRLKKFEFLYLFLGFILGLILNFAFFSWGFNYYRQNFITQKSEQARTCLDALNTSDQIITNLRNYKAYFQRCVFLKEESCGGVDKIISDLKFLESTELENHRKLMKEIEELRKVTK